MTDTNSKLEVSENKTQVAGNGYNTDKQPIHIVEKKMKFLIEDVYLKDKNFY